MEEKLKIYHIKYICEIYGDNKLLFGIGFPCAETFLAAKNEEDARTKFDN